MEEVLALFHSSLLIVCILTPVLTPATLTSPCGLVQWLGVLAPNLPSPAAQVVRRVGVEVADFLDGREQEDVALVGVDARWLREFTAYLNTFYDSAQVSSYLQVIEEVLTPPD